MRSQELILSEAGGIFKRLPTDPPFTALAGNQFGAKAGEKFSFVRVDSYPRTGAYRSPEERDQAIAKVTGKSPLVVVNAAAPNFLSFAIATVAGEKGQTVQFLRYFKEIRPNMLGTWKNNELPGLQSELRGSVKRRAGLLPKDVLGGKLEFANGAELLRHVLSLPSINPNIKKGLAMIGKGQMPVFEKSGDKLEAIRDNLGEIIQALCLTHGLVAGDADLARINIFEYDTKWQDMAIEFPASSTQGLMDFNLKIGDVKMGVSSKGGGGGAAGSISNLEAAMQRLSAKERSSFQKKYPDAYHLLDLNSQYTAKEIPLRVAQKFGIENIKESNVTRILSMIKSAETDLKKLNPWERRQVEQYAAAKPTGWNYGYWILAKIAKDVVEYFNSNPKNSKAFKDLLNKSAIMQCTTRAVVDEDDSVTITGIDSKFPLVFTGTVKLNSDKNYRANVANGTFGFKW